VFSRNGRTTDRGGVQHGSGTTGDIQWQQNNEIIFADDRNNIPMCLNHQFHLDLVHNEETGFKEVADLTGISGIAILTQ
jgi:hypothetical protein